MENKTSNIYIKYLSWLVSMIPIWWIIGLKPIIFHLIVTYLFIIFIYKAKKEGIHLVVGNPQRILIMFIIIYITSIIINSYSSDLDRIIASLYNLSYWIFGLFILVILSNNKLKEEDFIRLFSSFKIVGIFQGIMGILAVFYWHKGNHYVQYKSLLLKILPDSLQVGLLKSSMFLSILRTDWILNNPSPRITGFFIYPTALGIGMLIIMILSYSFYQLTNKSKIRMFLGLLLMLIALFYSLSRTVFIAFIIAFVIVKMFNLPRGKGKYLYLAGISTLSLTLIPMAYYASNAMDFLLDARSGSTDLRAKNYELAISKTLENPILGIGVKFNVPGIEIPIGSHSTYIGVLLKTGFLGLAVLLAFQISIFIIWVKAKRKIINNRRLIFIWENLGLLYIAINIWMLTEDIDAPQIIALFYFIICGLILSFPNLKSRNKRNFIKDVE